MASPDNMTDNKLAGKKGSIIMTILLFLAIITVTFFAYLKSQNTDIKNINIGQFLSGIFSNSQVKAAEKVYEIYYDTKEHPAFAAYNENIVKCNQDGIWFLDKKGREIWSERASLKSPVIKRSGKDLLVADIGGKDIFVINGQAVRWKGKTDENILNAEINEDGYVTVITESKLYNNEIRVYDSNGVELFRNITANDFAVTAKIAPSDRQMVIDGLNASGAKSYTYLKFFDINGEELSSKNLNQYNGIYPVILYADDSALFAVGNSSIVCLDSERNIKWEKGFSKIISACITSGKHLAAAVEESDGLKLKTFNTNGNELASCVVNSEIKNMNSYNNIIAVNNIREVNFYNERGNHIRKYSTRSDILNVYFFSKQQAVIVTKSYIVIVNIS